MKNFNVIPALLCALVLLAACFPPSQLAETAPSAVPSSAAAVTTAQATVNTTETSAPTATVTAAATAQVRPTEPLAIPAVTPAATSLPSVEAPAATATAAVSKLSAGGLTPKRETFDSPDKQWQAELTRFDCAPNAGGDAYEGLNLISLASGAVRLADQQLIYCGGLGAYGFQGLFWSPNSRYFYYTDAREGVPDGCGYWQPPVRRLDVTTGQFEELGYVMRSPDGAKLASWLNGKFVLFDINQGELGRWPAHNPDLDLSGVAWSSDGRTVAYLQAPSPCGMNRSNKSSVVRIDVATLTATVLLDTESQKFEGMKWEEPGIIKLVDDKAAEWLLDETGLKVR